MTVDERSGDFPSRSSPQTSATVKDDEAFPSQFSLQQHFLQYEKENNEDVNRKNEKDTLPVEWRAFSDVYRNPSKAGRQEMMSKIHFDLFMGRLYVTVIAPLYAAFVLVLSLTKPSNSEYPLYYFWILVGASRFINHQLNRFSFAFRDRLSLQKNENVDVVDMVKEAIRKKDLQLIRIQCELQWCNNNFWLCLLEMFRGLVNGAFVWASYIICTKESPVYLMCLLFLAPCVVCIEVIWKMSWVVMLGLNIVPIITLCTMYHIGCSAREISIVAIEIYVVQAFSIAKAIYMASFHKYELATESQLMLQSSEKMYKTLYYDAPSLFLSVCQNGRICNCNKSACKSTHYSAEQLQQDMTIFDLFAPESREYLESIYSQTDAQNQLDEENVTDKEMRLITKAGEVRDFVMNLSFIRHGTDKKIWLSNMVLQDITAQKKIQKELTRAKDQAEAASQFKTDFLSNMSHELRSPLVSICGITELLMRESGELSEKHADYVKTVQTSASMLRTLVNDILEVSKIEAGKIELESVSFCLEDCVEVVNRCVFEGIAKEKQLNCHIYIDPKLAKKHLKGDVSRLNQILVNISNNAVKFTPTDGSVNLSILSLDSIASVDGDMNHPILQYLSSDMCKRILKETPSSYYSSTSEYLVCSIKDTGIGIPKEKLGELFKKFTQLSSSISKEWAGTGLGLNISKSLVDLMNGKFFVESKQGEGSTFAFTVQVGVSDTPYKPRSHSTPEVPDRVFRWRVLIVDDGLINQKVLVHILNKIGIPSENIDRAFNGLAAFEMAQTHLETHGKPYDIIFMDICMPVMDGLESTLKIRGIPDYEKTPIVALTASASDHCKQQCLQLGMTKFCAKPYTVNAIVQILSDQASLFSRKSTTEA